MSANTLTCNHQEEAEKAKATANAFFNGDELCLAVGECVFVKRVNLEMHWSGMTGQLLWMAPMPSTLQIGHLLTSKWKSWERPLQMPHRLLN